MMTKWFLSGLMSLSVTASAGVSLNDQVDLTVLPAKPIVIDADTTDGRGRLIKGPWFGSRLVVDNHSSQELTVIGVNYQVISKDRQTDIEFSTDMFSWTAMCGTESIAVEYRDFGTFLSGDRGSLRLRTPNPKAGCINEFEVPIFYVGDLTAHEHQYKVVVTVLGWFGTYDNPTERLDKRFTFYTQ